MHTYTNRHTTGAQIHQSVKNKELKVHKQTVEYFSKCLAIYKIVLTIYSNYSPNMISNLKNGRILSQVFGNDQLPYSAIYRRGKY